MAQRARPRHAVISLPAGMARMPHWRFILWTAAGSTIWNVLLVAAGYYLGTNFRALDAYIGPAAIVMIVGICGFYAWRVAMWKPRG